MRRRDFIVALCGSAALPLGAYAQQGAVRRLGFLGITNAAAQAPWTAAFVGRLGELGWIEGQNLHIECRWAEGRTERFAQIATEFVQLKVDAVVTAGTAATLAAKRASSTIPVVFATAGDPVATWQASGAPRFNFIAGVESVKLGHWQETKAHVPTGVHLASRRCSCIAAGSGGAAVDENSARRPPVTHCLSGAD